MALTNGAGRGQVAADEKPSEHSEETMSAIMCIDPGSTFDLRLAPLTRRIEGRPYEMLAYNGSIPGPILRVRQGSQIAVSVSNIVEPADASYWPAVDREIVLTLDDILIEDGAIAPFDPQGATFTAMGRYGNVLLSAARPISGSSSRMARSCACI